jgi:predicted transcriptional regulator
VSRLSTAIAELSAENKALKMEAQSSNSSGNRADAETTEALRKELQHARQSLETLMQQARESRMQEDDRVARLRAEMEECEAGLEKQLLDALVDGSAAKVTLGLHPPGLCRRTEAHVFQ